MTKTKITYAIQANRVKRTRNNPKGSATGGWMTIAGAEYTDREQAERVFATKPKSTDYYYNIRLVKYVDDVAEVIS